MAIADDFSIDTSGNIRHISGSAHYTVIELHRWLGDLMDDAQAAGNDLLDITDATASERATDNLITLNSPYNIDDDAAKYLYDGSIVQDSGATIYDGIVVIANAGMYLEVIQNGYALTPNFWTTAWNADATNGISHRFLVKVRTGGADIDGRRLIGLTREFGFTFSEFKINGTSRGNNVMALTYQSDLNNQTATGTVAGWNTITNTEGYRSIDVDGNSTPENYYSEWNKASFTINQFYERMKWLTKRQESEDTCTDTGNDMALGNGTITRQGQSFTVGALGKRVTKVAFNLKKSGTPTGNITATLYAHTGSFGSTGTPTGAVLATSVAVSATQLSTSYQTFEFGFSTTVVLTAATNYFVVVNYTGDASNFVQVQGDTTGTHAGNRASFDGSWTAAAAEDLNFTVYGSPDLYGIAGNFFRGITHEIDVDNPSATDFSAVELVSWGTGTGAMLAINDVNAPTKMWIQLLTGIAPVNNDTITGATSGATCQMNVTITERTLSQPFCGVSTGSAIIGSYGFGIESADLTNLDKLFDLTNTQRTPPNNVTFTVGGLSTSSGGDRVLVGPQGYYLAYDGEASGPFQRGETLTFTGGETAYLSELLDLGTTGFMKIRLLTGSVPVNDDTITGGTSGATAAVNGTPVVSEDPRQLKLATTLSGATETAVVCTAAIPTDTPTTGTIRIQLNTGIYRRVAYTSYSGSTFTIGSTDFSGANQATGGASEAGNSIFISYIDKNATSTSESFTSVYSADRSLFVRARFGGSPPIKTFETSGTLSSSGGSATAIRTSDS